MTTMLEYYSRRAHEYERVYDKPERQADLTQLARLVRAVTRDRRVLEVACGTGYWTERYAPSARSVLGVDASSDVLAVARHKTYPPGRVRFAIADAYALEECSAIRAATPFDTAVIAFWWSHVPNTRLPAFMASLHTCLSPGSVVWIVDNRFVEGSSTPLSHADPTGNTYQRRRLDDGSEHIVLKSFPTQGDLEAAIGNSASHLRAETLDYFWVARYELTVRTPSVIHI